MSNDDRTSLTLLRRAAARDEEAWQRLVGLYSPLVAHWCRQAGLTGPDVEDMVQEVFAGIAAQLPNYAPDRAHATFRGWMRGIARHKLQDHFRRRAEAAAGGTDAQIRMNELPGPPAEAEVDLSEGEPELMALYHRALELVRSEFEERTWTAFWRAGVENQTTTEVAAALGTTPNAVRQAKSRVLRRLKEELGPLIA